MKIVLVILMELIGLMFVAYVVLNMNLLIVVSHLLILIQDFLEIPLL
jgi:hypothetical protein